MGTRGRDDRDKTGGVASLLHNPAEASQEHVLWAEGLKDAPGVTFGIDAVDKHCIPMHPGDLASIVARPGHGKTSLLAYLAKHEAERINRSGALDQAVVYVTWEQVTEEIDSLFLANNRYSATDIVRGKVDLDAVRANAVRRVRLPIWLVGHSVSRTSPDTPRMTMDVVWQLVEIMRRDYGVRPTLLCGDFLQLVPVPRASNIQTEVTYAAGLLKELATWCACPAVVASQARQEVDDYKFPLPAERDSQWSSRLFQVSDKYFSMMRPWLTPFKEKDTIPLLGREVPVTEELFVLKKWKERFNSPRFTWALSFTMQYLRLAELELEKEPLNF